MSFMVPGVCEGVGDKGSEGAVALGGDSGVAGENSRARANVEAASSCPHVESHPASCPSISGSLVCAS